MSMLQHYVSNTFIDSMYIFRNLQDVMLQHFL